ncbi:MAG TPA: S26 family signal peptidase [Myxococcota bacterium]|nr:S26 family signal peptidase [Myxococcota bacterium]HRY94704.1 S26 family signal peptidase [Myxococcota bacterium]HSA21306.1 S26 family signal peptidase [Myxococcota bacterium]
MEKPRSVLAAVLLSVPLPGLGHLYCGRVLWALGFILLHFAGWAVFLGGWAGLGWELGSAARAAFAVFGLALVAAAVHAGLCARRTGQGYRLRAYNLWYFYLLVWLAGFVAPTYGLFAWVRGSVLTTYPLLSDGMQPGLVLGDYVRVDRRESARASLAPGQVVAVRDPADGQTVRLLRVVALGPQEAELGSEGLALDGAPVPRQARGEVRQPRQGTTGEWQEQVYAESVEQIGGREVRVLDEPDPVRRRVGRWKLAAGQVLLLGDNRATAVDSSVFGPLPREAVLGVALTVRFSRDPRTGDWRPDRAGLDVR